MDLHSCSQQIYKIEREREREKKREFFLLLNESNALVCVLGYSYRHNNDCCCCWRCSKVSLSLLLFLLQSLDYFDNAWHLHWNLEYVHWEESQWMERPAIENKLMAFTFVRVKQLYNSRDEFDRESKRVTTFFKYFV